MSQFKILMPKLGESIQEATITKWFVKEGDQIAEDDVLFEVATDKVDSEIPSPVDGRVQKIFFPAGSLLPVGEILALISLSDEVAEEARAADQTVVNEEHKANPESGKEPLSPSRRQLNRFYSPLVRKIAAAEAVSFEELDSIQGSGLSGRVQKKDLLNYLEGIRSQVVKPIKMAETPPAPSAATPAPQVKASIPVGAGDQVIEMDRIRKLIADHMVMSKRVSPHVTSVVEADVTGLVLWRNKVKEDFQKKYGEKLTFMPLFMEATAKALAEFPWLNASVDEDKIILRKHINLGIAVAKPDGNLIVPVVKHAEEKSLLGLAKNLNNLAEAARQNKLSPDDIREGTFSITNFGSFRNLIGTPIINQPQVAILATGSIEKKPAVLELPTGDVIAIRHKMYLSLSYDHRVVDGALGGAFLRRIADLLEQFDINRTV